MRRRAFRVWLVLAAFLLLPGLASSQAKQENQTLVVSGRPGAAKVVQINGRSFVEIDALARLVNGSLRFNGNQIVLTIPASTAGAPAAQPKPPAFSKDFLRASVEAMTAIREWQSGLASDVQHGYPLPEDWMSNSRTQASKDVSLASVAATTDDDRSAMRLLSAEFNDMEQLNDNIVATSKAREYIPPDAMSKDPLNDRILNCAHSLASIIGSEKFVDDGTCY
ncbi:MAG: hypothetical protein WA405_02050 [Candidatus Acidiferrales bacterium]